MDGYKDTSEQIAADRNFCKLEGDCAGGADDTASRR